MSFSLSDIPYVGPALSEGYQAITGHPNDIKAAYDKAIASSQAGGAQIRDFLLGREAKAQQFYGPIQSMFNKAYGTNGIAAPQVPGVAGSTPFTSMYSGGGGAPAPDPGRGSMRRP